MSGEAPRKVLFGLAVAGLALFGFWLVLLRVQPGLIGWINDDGMYVGYAKALLDGHGYVETAMGDPIPARRYPIGFPALLALAAWGSESLTELIVRMQIVGPLSVALFVLVSAWYFRRHGFPAWGSLLGAALIAIQPDISVFGSMVLSDVPAAVLGLLTLILFEHAFRTSARARWWFAGGVLLAVCGLFRYALAPLGLAVALLLLKERRWKEAAWTAGGLLLAFGPWLLFRLTAGGEEYGGQAEGFLSMGAAQLLENFRLSVAYFLTSGLPAYLGPHLLGGWSLMGALTGVLLAFATLLGAIAWLVRPAEGQTSLGALVLLMTVAMVVVWEMRFITIGSGLVIRLLIPVAPLMLVAFVRGLGEVRARFVATPGRLAPRLLGLAALGVVIHGGQAEARLALDDTARAWQRQEQASNAVTLDFVRRQLPADARLASFKSSLVHLHSGRACHSLSIEQNNQQLLAMLRQTGSEYVVGLPLYMEVGKDRPQFVDASTVILNDMAKAYPGLFEPVFLSPDRTGIVVRVNRAMLEAAAD
ncbi:MAG: glycosyltransferase family 39 protein [Candidatus Sericytochromatia bacterium]